MPSSDDLYALLELSADATPDEIKRAYRRLAKRWHPDRNPNNPEAAERFKAIAAAFEMLSEPGRRRKFDARRAGEARDDDFLDRVADAVERGQRWAEQVVVPHIASRYRGAGVEMAVTFVRDAAMLRPGRLTPEISRLGRWRARRWLDGVEVSFDAGLGSPTALIRGRRGARILVSPQALWSSGVRDADQLDEVLLVLLVARYAQIIAMGRFVAPEGETEEAWSLALRRARDADTAALRRIRNTALLYSGVVALLILMIYSSFTGW